MQTPMKMLLTAGLGAATMYYLDPTRGRHRRALARARFEDGREALTHGVHQATHGIDRAAHRARVISRGVSRKSDKFAHGVRTLSHDLGDRAGQLAHGARTVGREARDRAAGAADTLGSLYERHRPNGAADYDPGGAPRGRILLIPVTTLLTIGVGVATMYFLDPTQGLYRRSRFRRRLADWREKVRNATGIGREKLRDASEALKPNSEDTTEQSAGNGHARHLEDRDPARQG